MSCAEITHAFRHVVRLPGYSVLVEWCGPARAYRINLVHVDPARQRPTPGFTFCRQDFAYEEYLLENPEYLRRLARDMYLRICEYQLREMERLYDR